MVPVFRSLVAISIALSVSASSIILRGTKVRALPDLPAQYCTTEETQCEADVACAYCLSGASIPDTPDVNSSNFTCVELNEWFYAITFNDEYACNPDYRVPLLTDYIYCMYDTYKIAAGIDFCETVSMSLTYPESATSAAETSTGFSAPTSATSFGNEVETHAPTYAPTAAPTSVDRTITPSVVLTVPQIPTSGTDSQSSATSMELKFIG